MPTDSRKEETVVMDYSGAGLFSNKQQSDSATDIAELRDERKKLMQELRAIKKDITNQGIAITMVRQSKHDPSDLHYMETLQKINRAQEEGLKEKIAANYDKIEALETSGAVALPGPR